MSKKGYLLTILFIFVVVIGIVVYLYFFNNKSYTIIFNSDGGSLVENQVVKKGEKVIEPDDPTKEDYLFLGWDINGVAYNFNEEVTKDLTLTATWEKNSEILFTGRYRNKDGVSINIYDFPDKRVQLLMTGLGHMLSDGAITQACREVNTQNNDGIITFKMHGNTYTIKRNKYDIELETTDIENFPNGIYEYVGNYLMEDYFTDSFFGAYIDLISEDKYNALYTRSDGGKLYMFTNLSNEEIVFISPKGIRNDIRLRIEYFENGETKLVPKEDNEYYRIEYNENNDEFVVTEFDGKGNKISNSTISGTYKFTKYLDGETIVNELQYLDLNDSIIVDNN